MIRLKCPSCGYEWSGRNGLPRKTCCPSCNKETGAGEKFLEEYKKTHPDYKPGFEPAFAHLCLNCGKIWEADAKSSIIRCTVCEHVQSRNEARRRYLRKMGLPIPPELQRQKPIRHDAKPQKAVPLYEPTKAMPKDEARARSVEEKREICKRYATWSKSIYEFCKKEGLSFASLNKILNQTAGIRATELRDEGVSYTESRLQAEEEIFGTRSQVLTIKYK